MVIMIGWTPGVAWKVLKRFVWQEIHMRKCFSLAMLDIMVSRLVSNATVVFVHSQPFKSI